MAPHPTHRRNLAPPDHKTSTDPTNRKLHKSTPTTTTAVPTINHPTNPDPTPVSSTIHTISKRFSNLYSNHHKSLIASSKQSNPPSKPRIHTHLQAKPSLIDDPSIKEITKSSQKQRKTLAETEIEKLRAAITGVVDQPKKGSSRKKDFYEVGDIKKQAFSMSRSLESGLKKVGDHKVDELKKRPSFSLTVTGVGGRRLSLCNSQTELVDFLSCNGVKIVSVDMPPFMQAHAVDCSRKTYDSMEKFSSRVLASTLKKEFDEVYGPAWHCIVGTSFGSFVTHSVGGFLYFSMDHKIYVLLFKTTVQRAD